jgi:hypothetical protein
MKFEISFNRDDKNDTKEFYDYIGAKLNDEHEEYNFYEIELDGFEDLEKLISKINLKLEGNTFSYSAVISFNNPTIFLDKNI